MQYYNKCCKKQHLLFNLTFIHTVADTINTISTRLKFVIEYNKLNINTFASRIGISQQSLYNYIEKGRTPPINIVNKIISAFPEINPLWILNGTGEYLNIFNKHTEKEKELTALVKFGEKFYSASNIFELENVVKEIKKTL